MMGTGRLLVLAALLVAPAARAEVPTPLDRGYRLMYGLDFASAAHVFNAWRVEHPHDPLGPVSEAANLLFAELDRMGFLQAQFFLDDSSFTSRRPPAPPAAGLRERFDATLSSAETLARARLGDEPHDTDALFALTMVYGLRADYAALIEGRGMAALSYTRQATRVARTLLEVAPDYADAYLSTGISRYIVGSLAAPLRWLLRTAGFSGDKARGIEDLKLTAEHGRFLGPFARILLTIVSLHEHDVAQARVLLNELQREFPSNPLFARELQRIDGNAM